jgi:predicted nucleotidyltransferase
MNALFLSEIKKRILEFDPDAQIILYGSRARGDYAPDSDWDLLILTSKPLQESQKIEIQKELYKIELESDEVISTIIQSADEWKQFSLTTFYQVVHQEGIVM